MLYGGDKDPILFQITRKKLHKVATSGANLFDVTVGSSSAEPAVIKTQQRDPVLGNITHLDLMRVKLDQKIQSEVPIELENADQAPGVREGGVLEHITREVTVEALPTDMPEHLSIDVSALEIGDNLTLADLTVEGSYELVSELDAVVATVSAPRKVEEEPTVEEEPGLVGEGEEGAEEGAEAAEGEEGGEKSADENE